MSSHLADPLQRRKQRSLGGVTRVVGTSGVVGMSGGDKRSKRSHRIHTMWGPRSIAKLVYNSNNCTMVYGRQITIVTGANPNQLITGGPHIVGSMVLLYMVTWIPSIYPSHVSIYTIHGSYGIPFGNPTLHWKILYKLRLLWKHVYKRWVSHCHSWSPEGIWYNQNLGKCHQEKCACSTTDMAS